MDVKCIKDCITRIYLELYFLAEAVSVAQKYIYAMFRYIFVDLSTKMSIS